MFFFVSNLFTLLSDLSIELHYYCDQYRVILFRGLFLLLRKNKIVHTISVIDPRKLSSLTKSVTYQYFHTLTHEQICSFLLIIITDSFYSASDTIPRNKRVYTTHVTRDAETANSEAASRLCYTEEPMLRSKLVGTRTTRHRRGKGESACVQK